MNIIFWGKGPRGVSCFNYLRSAGFKIIYAIAQGNIKKDVSNKDDVFISKLMEDSIPYEIVDDINDINLHSRLRALQPDIFALCGFGLIFKKDLIEIPMWGCINLHGGKLPEYRGSSPLNWALINGESEFTLSVIKVDLGIDTGDVLLEKTFPIHKDTDIRSLHEVANEEFPKMIVETLHQIQNKTIKFRKTNQKEGAYYPMRFAEDGFILWDQLTAVEAVNQIRALTKPYPCAFTFFNGKKILLLSASLLDEDYYGEPGRVYKLFKNGDYFVCAKDKCIRVTHSVFEESDIKYQPKLYDLFLTIRSSLLNLYVKKDA